jgi:hypothetical protein
MPNLLEPTAGPRPLVSAADDIVRRFDPSDVSKGQNTLMIGLG